MLGNDEQRMEDIFYIMCVFARLYVMCDIYIKADRYTCEVEREEI